MIDVQQVVAEKLSPEMVEFLRRTLPNLGFYGLMEQMRLDINLELVNLNTKCDGNEFRHKYDKLILERDVYEQLYNLAKMLNDK